MVSKRSAGSGADAPVSTEHRGRGMTDTQLIGCQISHYYVIERLGEGGMGVVYRAEDVRLKRTVALKVLIGSLAGEEQYKRRFLREAQTASAINHPNICTVYDVMEESDNAIIVMEYVDGMTLRRWMQSQARTLRGTPAVDETTIINIISQVADGLGAAHQQGIVHRDIKPENIMLTSRRWVKIMDFGLAKLKTDSRLTTEGSTLGTLRYMAPEQVRGEDADARSDIYSVGIVLYEALCGQIPWQSDHNAALMYAKLNYPPAVLSEARIGTSVELNRIVMKCIEKSPSARYQSLAELKADLAAYDVSSVTQRISLDPVARFAALPGLPKVMLERTWNRMSVPVRWVTCACVVLALALSLMILRRAAPFSYSRVSVVTTPPGAGVEINNQRVGESPLIGYEVPPGKISVYALLPGYAPAESTLTLGTGDAAALDIRLEPSVAAFGAPAPGPSRVTARSIPDLAAVIAADLRRRAGIPRGRVLVAPLAFGATSTSSPFAKYFQSLLEARLAGLPGWVVVAQKVNVDPGGGEVSKAFSLASGADLMVSGTYWIRDDVAEFFVSLREISGGAIRANSEASIGAGVLARTRLGTRPVNLEKVLHDQQVARREELHAGRLTLDAWTNRGKENVVFTEGDTIAVYARVDQPCYVRVIYNAADGSRYLFSGLEDMRVEGDEINRKVLVNSASCAGPFGAEMIQVFARSEKFDHINTTGDPLCPQIVDNLQDALKSTRGVKPLASGVAHTEKMIVITTLPSRNEPAGN